MYVLLIVLLLAAGALLLRNGVRRNRGWERGLGILLLLGTPVFFALLSSWGELLWYDALGFSDRFWTALWAQLGLAVAGCVTAVVNVWLLTLPIPRERRLAVRWPKLAGGIVGLFWGWSQWQVLLMYWHRVPTGSRDPIFGHDISFFLFTLPLLDAVSVLLLLVTLVSISAALISLVKSPGFFASFQRGTTPGQLDVRYHELNSSNLAPLQVTGGVFILVWSVRSLLSAYHLMQSKFGVVHGPGWTDVHIRLPAYMVVAALLLIAGIVLIAEAILRRADDTRLSRRRMWITASPLVAAVLCWAIGLILLPGLSQWLYVQPNEVSVERPYIEHNIRLTRQAFQLDKIEEQQFPVSPEFTDSTAEDNHRVLSQVRLWDPRALNKVYEQFQEIRLYYEFNDVDIDRYEIDGEYRQVMISAREMELKSLAPQSQTFVNRRFKYTHGCGLTMAPVNEFTSGGLPNLLIKDLPPKSESTDVEVQRPEIYYGELTDTHVIVNTTEEEFDYPSGEQNVYTHYSGRGGVEISSLWRKLIFGWKFDGTRLFVSSYPRPESRILFRRQIHQRLQALAPFLSFDEDPYLVLDGGKLWWIADGYTVSSAYPYSEPFSSRESTVYQRDDQQQRLHADSADYLRGANYVRNSVKAVVNAFDGSVRMYVFEPEDPLIQVWQKIFPGLFEGRDDMPESLRAHIRYPEGLLLAQGLVYARYHMTNPDVFYNQEDVWVRATEKYDAKVQPVEPYYVMWKQPGASKGRDEKHRQRELQFILMQPFTPKNRQVLIGWIAGMCDGDNYGRLLAYRFPKEKRVLGTQQVETKIDQDSFLSKQLSLWDQRGSRVVRGNVLAIPVDDTLLYVEPIYLQAEAAAYPELRMVAVMHDDRLSYAEDFETALEGLYADREPAQALSQDVGVSEMADRSIKQLASQASAAFDAYLQSLSEKDFDAASRHLNRLSVTLERLRDAGDSIEPSQPVVSDEP